MSENVNGFTLFGDQERIVSLLTDEQAGQLFRALYAHHRGEDLVLQDPMVQLAFWNITESMDRVKRYMEKQRQNGAKGGRPVTQTEPAANTTETQPKPNNNPTVTQAEPTANPEKPLGLGLYLGLNKKEKDIYSASADAAQPQIEPLKGKKKTLRGKRAASFMRFWEAFSDKRGKADAIDAWAAIPELTDAMVDSIVEAAARYAAERERMKLDGRTPKMAQGWISSRRWEDEPDAPLQRHDQSAQHVEARQMPQPRPKPKPEPPAWTPPEPEEDPGCSLSDFLSRHPEYEQRRGMVAAAAGGAQ